MKIKIKNILIFFLSISCINATQNKHFDDAPEVMAVPSAGKTSDVEACLTPLFAQSLEDPWGEFSKYGLSQTKILQARILEDALHTGSPQLKGGGENKENKPNSSSAKRRKADDFDPTTLTPTKKQKFQEQGGDPEELNQSIQDLKTQYPSPVRNTAAYPRTPGVLSSPVARPLMSRYMFGKAIDAGAVRHLFSDAYQQPIIEETDAERLERIERQKADFLEIEKRRGQTPEGLDAEIGQEFKMWQDHLNYIKMRKDQLLEGKEEVFSDEDGEETEETIEEASKEVKKIRRGEIEDTFYQFVASQVIGVKINGYDVYYSLETLSFDRENMDGETNREIMESGRCPIGADGKSMNYHHLTHYDYATHKTSSIIVLITDSLHKMHSGSLHFKSGTYQDLPRKPVDRNLFTSARTEFNKYIAQVSAD